MKALILAGGLGTRLRPLSCTRPKLLFPVANRPLLDLTLQKLAENAVEEVVLAVNFMADALERAFGDERFGMTLHYSKDKLHGLADTFAQKALGTGGAVKQAESLLGKEDPFFVLNGDILTDASYSEILKEHRSNNGVATLTLHEVEDPSRFGVVELTEKGRITRFVEKPSKGAPSNLANAGIYVLEPEVFTYIKPRERSSLERDVFPKLAERGVLFGHETKGLWVDVGKPADYIKANRLWLELKPEESVQHLKKVGKPVKVGQAVALGSGVVLGKFSAIGPNVSLGRNVSVGRKTTIKNSIVLPDTKISDLTTIDGAILGASVTVGKAVRICEGCLIGDSAVIQDNVALGANAKVCPSEVVMHDTVRSKCSREEVVG